MSGRTYLSIGDVLALLRQEFPDVTISKIRFLESQGLVDPERTPSGYRKFYDHDVERLRWVLRQQREHFLPLKVIKGRLEQEPPGGEENGLGDEAAAHEPDDRHEPVLVGRVAGRADPEGRTPELPGLRSPGHGGRQAEAGTAGSGRPGTGAGPQGRATGARSPGPAPTPAAVTTAAAPAAGPAGGRAGAGVAASPRAGGAKDPGAGGDGGPAPAQSAARGGARGTGAATPRGARPDAPAAVAPSGSAATTGRRGQKGDAESPLPTLSGTSMTAEELAQASGLDVAAVGQLESFGLVCGRVVGGVAYYEEDALTVARLAAGFARYGVEARHLRLHKHAAEREAGFIEQIVLPLLKQRNPEARQRAHDAVADLTRLGQGLREVLLRSTLRDQLGG